MNFLYNTAIALYSAGARLFALRDVKARKMIDGQRRTIPYLRKVMDGSWSSCIWIHASSLGEFEQGRPMIEMIKARMPEKKILLTFFSPSGYEVRKNFPAVDAVCYLPFDCPGKVRGFLDAVRPSMAIFIKYEFWGNFLQELARRNIPTYLISAIFRPSQSFFKWWGGMFRDMLKCYTHLYVQDEESSRLLEGIGVKNVTVAGDTRFDRVSDIMAHNVDILQAKAFASGGSPVIVAGSTWTPDEDFLLPYFNAHKSLKLIIAPHEVNAERIAEIERRLERRSCRLSVASVEEAARVDCLIVDCYGKLSSLYRYGNVAYIGGGFGVGIHNINEAAVYNMPVVFGPKYSKFKEAKDLVSRGGAFTFDSKQQFEEIMDSLTCDAANLEQCGEVAGSYIRENLGATERIFSDIFRRR